jgi:uncharacterized protein YndB with AHSA1/START domain
MATETIPESLELTAERWIPHPVESVWKQCTSREGLESWWSPEDLRTNVRRLEARTGGGVEISLRYVPALVSPGQVEAFRASGVPISFLLLGRILELEMLRCLVFELTLSVRRAGSGITTVTRLNFESRGGGTIVKLVVSGKSNPHWVTLGRANLEAQLDRLGRSLEGKSHHHMETRSGTDPNDQQAASPRSD